jgi:Zn finger protein HypA/HybF involved in hydrogenase expression
MTFSHSTKVKCPQCGHEWYTFRSDAECPKCKHYIKSVDSCKIGTGTAADVIAQEDRRVQNS